MKIAVSSQGKELDSPMDPRFGRTSGFLIVDIESMKYEYKPNLESMQLSSGAGVQAAGTIADAGANAVITGRVGPKAFDALNKAGIDIYISTDNSVRAAIESFKTGKLSRAPSADPPMGAGMGRGGGAGMGGRIGGGGVGGRGGGRGMGGGGGNR